MHTSVHDDDNGDGDHISGGADADDSDRSDGFDDRKIRLGDGRNADGGGGGADRSYKQHAADRGSSQRISATTKFDVPGGLKGRKKTTSANRIRELSNVINIEILSFNLSAN